MWMPLTDVASEVGSMIFARGSHLLGDLRGPVISDESEALFAAVVRDRALPEDTHGVLTAGDATFHAGWTLHRAGGNPTAASRPVMTIIYYEDGARVTEPTDDYQRFDLAMWLPGSAPGELADGEHNLRLW
jgi:ectoine hydroxylase-related dioxygenase (phytanoyl-CoA dioxygenase family)